MAGDSPTLTTVRFGPFELFPETGELRKDGVRLKLSGQPIQVLMRLVATPGKLVTRQELQRQLWPGNTFGDFEKGLNATITRLRTYLNDSASDPTYIETIAGRGYRFIAQLEAVQNGGRGIADARDVETHTAADSTKPTAPPEPEPSRTPAPTPHRWRYASAAVILLALAVAAIAIVAAIFVWWRTPPAAPVVESVTQLTDDGQPKGSGSVVTDGSRVYFDEGGPGSRKIVQVSAAGGETSTILTRLTDPRVEGIAPDGSSLLIFDGETYKRSLWTVLLPTGEARRLGTVEGQDGNFFPDGRLVFTQGTSLFAAEKDGTEVHKLLTAPGSAWCPRVSPDDKRIVLMFYQDHQTILAEASADGSGLHEIMRGTQHDPVACAYWTPDGKYLFTRTAGNLVLLPTKMGFFEKYHKPIQLTNGPLIYYSLCPSRDGKRIFAIGTKMRGELVRYDVKSKRFIPLLSGISAINPSFSQDGQWVVYVSYPDFALWRSRADGTDRLRLTYPPMEVIDTDISPDGKKAAFGTAEGEQYVVNMDGTSQREITKRKTCCPTWSPDGNSLAFTAEIEDGHGDERSTQQLETFDMRSGKRSVIASSVGLIGNSWMNSDTLIARPEHSTNLVRFDMKSGKQTELVSGMVLDWATSPDRKYLYYTIGGAEPKAMRLRLADHKVEEIVNLKELPRVAYTFSVEPDGSPVFTRDIGSQEIYALSVKWP